MAVMKSRDLIIAVVSEVDQVRDKVPSKIKDENIHQNVDEGVTASADSFSAMPGLVTSAMSGVAVSEVQTWSCDHLCSCAVTCLY